METESRPVAAREREWGAWGVNAEWGQTLSCETEKVLERDGGDGCTIEGIYLMPLNCIHLKMVKMVYFMYTLL